MRKNISVTNKRVLKAMNESDNASRLIEEAIIYYLDSIDREYITKDEVREMILSHIGNIKIDNPNYQRESFDKELNAILEL